MKIVLSTLFVLGFALNLSPVFAAEDAGAAQAQQQEIIVDQSLFNGLSRMLDLADIQISQQNREQASQIIKLGLAALNGKLPGDLSTGEAASMQQTQLAEQLTALLDRYGPQLVDAVNEILLIAREEIAKQDWTAANEWLKWGLSLLGELYYPENIPTEKAFMEDNSGVNLIRANSMENALNTEQAALLREAVLSNRLTLFRKKFKSANSGQAAQVQ